MEAVKTFNSEVGTVAGPPLLPTPSPPPPPRGEAPARRGWARAAGFPGWGAVGEGCPRAPLPRRRGEGRGSAARRREVPAAARPMGCRGAGGGQARRALPPPPPRPPAGSAPPGPGRPPRSGPPRPELSQDGPSKGREELAGRRSVVTLLQCLSWRDRRLGNVPAGGGANGVVGKQARLSSSITTEGCASQGDRQGRCRENRFPRAHSRVVS
jgi:hypothetical protein